MPRVWKQKIRIAWTLTGCFALLIVVLTLTPSGYTATPGTSFCLICGERGVADSILNVILFTPLGMTLFLATRSGTSTVLGAAVFSAIIEISQISMTSRDGNPGDVVFNTLGAALGWLLVLAAPALFTASLRRLLCGVSVGVAIVILTVSAALFAPHLPNTTYFGQWTAQLENLEWYRGKVLDARVGEVHVPTWQVSDNEALRSALRSGAVIEANVLAGPRVNGLAPIFSIADDQPVSIRFLGVDRDDAVFRFRTLSSAVRLDEPELRLRGAFAAIKAGQQFMYAVHPRGDSFCVRVAHRVDCGVGYRLQDGWRLLFAPDGWPNAVLAFIGFCWIAGLFVLSGLFVSRWREFAVIAVLVMSATVVIPYFTPVLATDAIAPLAAVAGTALGVAIRLLIRPVFDTTAHKHQSSLQS